MNLTNRYLKSLLAKPFVVLTGNSGSGKSKLALLFAEWLSGKQGYEFVAVGADWTDNRNVLGYANTLRTVSDEDSTPVFQATAILKLLRRAEADWKTNGEAGKAKPWFIILDEMNLSHIERYFSDFLAHIEATEEPIRLHSEKTCAIATDAGKYEELGWSIHITPNVFVVGTVNVDETTYMFSPKVLDRANVIEFRVSKDALERARDKRPSTPKFSHNSAATDFLELSMRARSCSLAEPGSIANGQEATDKEGWQSYKKCISDVFQILQRRNLEFGFRVQKEMISYGLADYHLHMSPGGPGHKDSDRDSEPWDWRRCFDEQLMQKVLPKLHGDQANLQALLSALLRYCEKELDAFDDTLAQLDSKTKLFTPKQNFDELQKLETAVPKPEDVRFPLSYTKLCRMHETLKRDQFVSYIG